MRPVSSPALRLFDRRALLVGLAAAPSVSLAAPCAPVRVLFVCPAGTVKSPIARDLLKAEAGRRALPVEVNSRGIEVADHVSEALAAHLRADGIAPSAQPARALASSDVAQADLVIAFDAAAEDPRLKAARAWSTPSWNADYDAAKADMLARVLALADELQTRTSGCR